ncbi:MAG: hypothetical protein QXI33_00900 [Candidatus Pacearchaeota archaeon]
MMIIREKKAAIELSMTTIIVIVLSIVLLILGFVFVRSIMCRAIGFTDAIGSKVDGEIQRLFESSQSEIACVGAGDAVPMTPGQQNFVWCGFNSKTGGNYRVVMDDISSTDIDPRTNIRSWVSDDSWTDVITPNDRESRKVITLNIPEDAPEGNIRIKIRATRDGKDISGRKDLDFRITRQGVIRNVLC